ncbi:MAG: [FeFe] hydrogenase H-cluster maturation GTPase HydF [Fusobacteriaceae bacterium]|nr:[FeFe] hydrogenase H-cluster maturation GTPase HydF [Fusobacteriaceae bacterium]
MNNTPNSNRKHIGIFGKTNAGKSSLLNAILEQDISIVSSIHGTTTDSVTKAMELIPFGPVLFIDTAGLNDATELGHLRVEKALKELKRTDFALYIVDATEINSHTNYNNFLKDELKIFKQYNLPYLLIINKIDLLNKESLEKLKECYSDAVFVSTHDRESILNFKSKLIKKLSVTEEDPSLIKDLVPYNGTVLMVVPIDSEAPKGRIILPQVQLIRDCLDSGIKSYVVRDTELESAMSDLKQIDLIVTDSQAFKEVDAIVKGRYPLTGFSILFARQKGDLATLVNGAHAVKNLKDGSRILIAETCTHNTSHEDIGRVKIPNLLKKKTGKNLEFEFKMGKDFPTDLSSYDLVIHCGGCMINRKNMQNRMDEVLEKEVPITNYGVVLAYLTGILDKATEIFNN